MQIIEGTCRINGFALSYAGATHPGCVRRCNEDNLLIAPDSRLFAVADGLGGLDAGDVASGAALTHLRDLATPGSNSRGKIFSLFSGAKQLRQLEAVVVEVNRRTYNQRMALGKNMATTLALVQFHHDQALIAHVGDSRIYLCRRQTLRRITSDHSLVNQLLQQGVLTARQAEQSPQRHVITRAIGAEPTVTATLHQQQLEAGDQLLLCTDGLTTMVSDADIGKCLDDASPQPGQLVERLIHLANEAGGHDNITVVLVAVLPE